MGRNIRWSSSSAELNRERMGDGRERRIELLSGCDFERPTNRCVIFSPGGTK